MLGQLAQTQTAKDSALRAKLGGDNALAAGAKWDAVAQRYARLYQLLLDIKHRKDEICQLKERLGKAKQKLQAQKTCPLCGNPLTT